MTLKKWFTLVEMLIVIVILGIMAAAILPRLMHQQIKEKVQREMPKTYEYVTSNANSSNFYTVEMLCRKTQGSLSMEMVSDEVCYNRMRVYDSCNNVTKTRKLENLTYFIDNEQQAETIINICKLKKQEILKEEINKLEIKEEINKEEVNKEETNKEESNKTETNKEETNKEVNINNEILNTMVESL